MKSTKKWAVRRNLETYKEINEYFGKLNNRNYSATGRWEDEEGNEHSFDFLVFPHIYTSTFAVREIPKGYEEVSYCWFIHNILNKAPKTLTYEIY